MSGELMGTTELRASHADRDRVVDVLTGAAGDGRLTSEELDERVEAALSARTMGELAVLTDDLPAVAGTAPVEVKDVVRFEQNGGSTRRADGWVVPGRLEIQSRLGDVTLDFTQAVITRGTLRIDLDMQLGELRLLLYPLWLSGRERQNARFFSRDFHSIRGGNHDMVMKLRAPSPVLLTDGVQSSMLKKQ